MFVNEIVRGKVKTNCKINLVSSVEEVYLVGIIL